MIDKTTPSAGASPSPDVEAWVAAVRAEKGLPDDWVWAWCQNGCGDVVLYDPVVEVETRSSGAVFGVVCSAACGAQYVKKVNEGGSGK